MIDEIKKESNFANYQIFKLFWDTILISIIYK